MNATCKISKRTDNTWFHSQVLSRAKRAGGKCETSADCVAPNVCSKWGWCQWTKIYGEDGPSQGRMSSQVWRASLPAYVALLPALAVYLSAVGLGGQNINRKLMSSNAGPQRASLLKNSGGA